MDVSSFLFVGSGLPPAGAHPISIEVQVMHKDQVQQTMADIIERAQTGVHTPFEYIRNWSDYRKRKISRHALKLLIQSLEYNTESIFHKHCKSIVAGTTDVTQLLIYNVLVQTVKFYKLELAMAEDMIYEYEAYLSDGHLIDAWLFNEYRALAECWDRRGME